MDLCHSLKLLGYTLRSRTYWKKVRNHAYSVSYINHKYKLCGYGFTYSEISFGVLVRLMKMMERWHSLMHQLEQLGFRGSVPGSFYKELGNRRIEIRLFSHSIECNERVTLNAHDVLEHVYEIHHFSELIEWLNWRDALNNERNNL